MKTSLWEIARSPKKKKKPVDNLESALQRRNAGLETPNVLRKLQLSGNILIPNVLFKLAADSAVNLPTCFPRKQEYEGRRIDINQRRELSLCQPS
jgi:hypothetical protein